MSKRTVPTEIGLPEITSKSIALADLERQEKEGTVVDAGGNIYGNLGLNRANAIEEFLREQDQGALVEIRNRNSALQSFKNSVANAFKKVRNKFFRSQQYTLEQLPEQAVENKNAFEDHQTQGNDPFTLMLSEAELEKLRIESRANFSAAYYEEPDQMVDDNPIYSSAEELSESEEYEPSGNKMYVNQAAVDGNRVNHYENDDKSSLDGKQNLQDGSKLKENTDKQKKLLIEDLRAQITGLENDRKKIQFKLREITKAFAENEKSSHLKEYKANKRNLTRQQNKYQKDLDQFSENIKILKERISKTNNLGKKNTEKQNISAHKSSEEKRAQTQDFSDAAVTNYIDKIQPLSLAQKAKEFAESVTPRSQVQAASADFFQTGKRASQEQSIYVSGSHKYLTQEEFEKRSKALAEKMGAEQPSGSLNATSHKALSTARTLGARGGSSNF